MVVPRATSACADQIIRRCPNRDKLGQPNGKDARHSYRDNPATGLAKRLQKPFKNESKRCLQGQGAEAQTMAVPHTGGAGMKGQRPEKGHERKGCPSKVKTRNRGKRNGFLESFLVVFFRILHSTSNAVTFIIVGIFYLFLYCFFLPCIISLLGIL